MLEWEEFLVLAKELALPERNEASLRTAISRAYNCVYHRATATCRSQLLMNPKRHQLWRPLREFGVQRDRPDLVDIGRHGVELRWIRIQVDYFNPFNTNNLSMKPLPVLARDAIIQADELLDLIDRL